MKRMVNMDRFIRQFLRLPPNVDLRERRYYLTGMAVSSLSLIAHCSFLVLFLFLHIWPLFFFNILSIGIFTFSLVVLLPRRLYSASMLVALFEVVAHQVLCVALIGWNAGFQYYLLAFIIVAALTPNDWKGRRGAIVVGVVSLICLDVFLRQATPPFVVDPFVLKVVHAANLFVSLLIIIVGATYFINLVRRAEDEAAQEHERAEGLLRNILPDSIAERLKQEPKIIAEGFEDATVLFSDIVGFTRYAGSNPAEQVVSTLNEVFTMFDEAAERYRLEKIKTIGDAYMVAAGVPEPGNAQDQAERVGDFALEMIETLTKFNDIQGTDLALRIGINSGPVVAGVIGKKKFTYDLWGDTVNLASRMESQGLPNCVHVAPRTHELLNGRFILESRGVVKVRGKGPTQTWILTGRKEVPAQSESRSTSP